MMDSPSGSENAKYLKNKQLQEDKPNQTKKLTNLKSKKDESLLSPVGARDLKKRSQNKCPAKRKNERNCFIF